MNIKKLNEELKKVLNTTKDKYNESFNSYSIISKDVAILRYLCGAIALNSAYDIEDYDEEDLYIRISSNFDTQVIEVENGKAYLVHVPDYNLDISARGELPIDPPSLEDAIDKVLAETTKELIPQLQEYKDYPDLSDYAKGLLGIE